MTATVPDHADRRAWAIQVATILNSLPMPQADVLRLLYFERLTDREAAARAGLTLKRARSAAADGLRAMGESLRAQHPPLLPDH